MLNVKYLWRQPEVKLTKILLVDDNDQHRTLYRHWFMVEFPRLEWSFAYPCPDIDSLAGYSIVVLDYDLGDSNGAEIAKDLIARHPEVRVCILTGHDADKVAAEVPELPNEQVLSKSDLDEVCNRLKALFLKWQVGV